MVKKIENVEKTEYDWSRLIHYKGSTYCFRTVTYKGAGKDKIYTVVLNRVTEDGVSAGVVVRSGAFPITVKVFNSVSKAETIDKYWDTVNAGSLSGEKQ